MASCLLDSYLFDNSYPFGYIERNLPCNRLGFAQVDEQGLFLPLRDASL